MVPAGRSVARLQGLQGDQLFKLPSGGWFLVGWQLGAMQRAEAMRHRPDARAATRSFESSPVTGAGPVEATGRRRPPLLWPSSTAAAALPSCPLSGIAPPAPPRTKYASPPPRESLNPHECTKPKSSIARELRLPTNVDTRLLNSLPPTRAAGPAPPLRPYQPRARSPPPQE